MSRPSTSVLPPVSHNVPSFLIESASRTYKHQYANIYYLRLQLLKDIVQARAHKKWQYSAGNPLYVPRVLEVVKAQLSYVVGTVYMDMPLKPNVLKDIATDRSLPQPPPRPKMFSNEDAITLEDESGRIILVGDAVKTAHLVTGVIVAALGMETPAGEFEVVDLCFAGLAPQTRPPRDVESSKDGMDIDDAGSSDEQDPWLALVSGLDIGSATSMDSPIQLMSEYLSGESEVLHAPVPASSITRLLIVGDSLSPVDMQVQATTSLEDQKKRRYGQETASFSNLPTVTFSSHLLDIGQTLPIHLLPGANDPSGTILPQQPFPRAMFGKVASYATFSCESNPTYLHLSGPESSSTNKPSFSRNLLLNSGQPINDMFKYLPSPPVTRLSILENTLRWRHQAPTAPDTLWCHPYFTNDPFIIKETPDLYIIGSQPRFATKVVHESPEDTEDGQERSCRIIMVPSFAKTGELVLVNMRTLGVRTMKFDVEGARKPPDAPV